MQINHVLLYKFKHGIDRIDEHLEAILKFRDNTEGLLDLKCGRNIAQSSSAGFTHGFIMTFESKDAFDKYKQSEAHINLADRFRDDMENKSIFTFCSL